MINITPINDLHDHKEDSTCNCDPNVIIENGEIIIVHNSFDGREGVEWVKELLS